MKGAFPGFGIAVVAFTGYVIFEAVFLKDSHGHAEVHGDKH
jgi:NADH dehydrogenase (ubiquinone) 1 beta subcomplex subunit 3